MTKHVWREGPPPSIGWWPASYDTLENPEAIRWWDGECWSWSVHPTDSDRYAAYYAGIKTTVPLECIAWCARWWE